MELVVIVISCVALGGCAGFALARRTSAGASLPVDVAHQAARITDLEDERGALIEEVGEYRSKAAVLESRLESEERRFREQLANEQTMAAEFDRLARTTLKETGAELVKAAESSFRLAQQVAKGELDSERSKIEHLVQPVQENLNKLERFIALSEQDRKQEYGDIFRQMQVVAEASVSVQAEAAQLKNVLRSSTSARGRWGEVQLRRVVELAGMREHADFSEQTGVSNDDGSFRADLIVHLPGDVKIAVDAKVPFAAYEKAQRTEDVAVQKSHFVEHAKQVRAHIDQLAKRAYWQHYLPSCGFAVLFVPGEALLDSALMHDPALWESAAEKNILLATPSTLIALLRMAALGWRQEGQAESAAEVARLGRELHRRLSKMNEHIDKVGRQLKGAVGSYNDFVGSLEGRVMPQARRLSDLASADGAVVELRVLDESPRQLQPGGSDRQEHDVVDVEEG